MRLRIFLILIILPLIIRAQYTIKGNMNPSDGYSWILLYKIVDGKQIYLDNTEIENDIFEFTIPESEIPGVYRIYYQLENQLYVEFIYNNENVEFSFSPNDPFISTYFSNSDENILFQKYYDGITKKQSDLDSLQAVYFSTTDIKVRKNINKYYTIKRKEINEVQLEYENISKGKLAHNFIKASKQYNNKNAIETPNEYLIEVKNHFFDAIDFNDLLLLNSTFITDKIMDFIFYLNLSDDITELNKMHKESINISLAKIESNLNFKKNVEELILDRYVSEQNEEMVNFVLTNYYNNLPLTLQDQALKNHVLAEIKTSVGKKAPNISWDEYGIPKNLYEMDDADYYIIVFYSSGCPHCQVEIPLFYDFILDVSNIEVIAIGLEEEKAAWEEMVKGFTKFTNILDLDKWDSKRVQDFGFSTIPSYFILNKDKIIIAKPEDLEEVKKYFP